ncbi:MAG: hydrogenase expression/formation protein HypE [Deltaproteobacteria bacterium]|nr:hydrogenase expression/formation protein HypE [Deltaproteobacteria bacterium]
MTNKIEIAHGGGGLLTRQLIEDEIVSRFGDGPLEGLPDGANLPSVNGRIVFSTDSFVVSPNFFPGGNIGDLAVHGTVNDLAVSGAKPLWLSLALILEEGLEIEKLRTILDSVKAAADDCGVKIVTGDTKVVAKGQCDGVYINTAGIGEAYPYYQLETSLVEEGDVVIVSGNLGDHGMAIMGAREGLLGDSTLKSDSAPVHRLVKAIKPFAGDIKFMRDPTRGGLAAVLNEIAESTEYGIELKETDIPFSPEAKGLAEILGFDLLHVASEGRMLLVCREDSMAGIIKAWKELPEGKNCAVIGRVNRERGRVVLETAIGGRRIIDVPRGELLPRIC